MTKRESDNIQIPDRTHDQPAEESPAVGPDGIDSTTEGLEERMPSGVEPPV